MKKILFYCLSLYVSLSCNPKEILEPNIDFPAFVVIDGDTVKTRDDKGIKDKFKGHPEHFKYSTTGDTIVLYKTPKKTKPSKVANLKNIENADRKGKPFRLVVFGGSLAAGVRDGGLFNEGMETSFGSLLANQMGIDFKNPLFDAEDYNGYGRLEPTSFNPTRGPIPKVKNVTNNSGVDLTKKEANGDVVIKKTMVEYDNYAFPYSSFIGRGETKLYITGESTNITPFEKRMGNPNLNAEIKAGKTFDFFIMEVPKQDFYIGLSDNSEENKKHFDKITEFDNLNPPSFSLLGLGVWPYYYNFFKKTQRIKAKGIILNYVDESQIPFYNQDYKKELSNIISKYQLKELYISNSDKVDKFDVTWLSNYNNVYGFAAFDSLLSPVVNINLKPGLLMTNPTYFTGINRTNSMIDTEKKNQTLASFATGLSYPIVDLFSLYKSVSLGNLITNDGIKVDGKWPRGNFFSSDGIHPSAFGQAVITNEIIKVINNYYKTDIPFINTRDFLK